MYDEEESPKVTRCLVFCRYCGLIVAEFEHPYVPDMFRCPKCGHLEKVFWQKHCTQIIKYDEDGKIIGLHRWMIATSVQGKLGAMLMLMFPRFDWSKNGKVSPVLNVR